MSNLIIRFVSPEITYASDKFTGPLNYSWSACARESHSKCDFRGFEYDTRSCKYNGLLPGTQKMCIQPSVFTNLSTIWNKLEGVPLLSSVTSSPSEFQRILSKNYYSGDWNARGPMLFFVDIAYSIDVLVRAAPIIALELVSMWNNPRASPYQGQIEHTPENYAALTMFFESVGFAPSTSSIINQACSIWWRHIATNKTKETLCNASTTNLMDIKCANFCNSNDANCDEGIRRFCSSLSPTSQLDEYASWCGCFQPSNVTDAYYQTISRQVPGTDVLINKQDICGYPPCIGYRPFASKTLICPSSKSCIQSAGFYAGNKSNVLTPSILIENSCGGQVDLQCPSGMTSVTSGNFARCCVPIHGTTTILNSNNECDYIVENKPVSVSKNSFFIIISIYICFVIILLGMLFKLA